MQRMNFTHVQLLPIMEHPFYGSWGYQTTGYFGPDLALRNAQDFMYFVDFLHQRGFGVILDWVPSHFPTEMPMDWRILTARICLSNADSRKAFIPTGRPTFSTTVVARFAAFC